MYVTSVEIQNIKSLRDVKWVVDPDKAAGWHTILGVNGSGKSTFARTIALALIGEKQSYAFPIDWKSWIGVYDKVSSANVKVTSDPSWDPSISEATNSGSSSSPHANVHRLKISERGLFDLDSEKSSWHEAFLIRSEGSFGYFSAGFGPFRRFTGGGSEFERKLESLPSLTAHISLFDESTALSSSIEWLRQLHYRELEFRSADNQKSPTREIKFFLNQEGFLPGNVRLDQISSAGVVFKNKDGATVNVFDMSDGFRSILSLTFELLRLLNRHFSFRGPLFKSDENGATFVDAPGVVLIDEVDAHLHPTWQRKIGPWFTKHFPNMQFIVTTHSPFVCQASEQGTIFVLDGEGGGRFLEGKERDRIIYGDILDAYSTGVFGEGMTRSDSSQEKHKRLAELNTKSVFTELSVDEIEERDSLRSMMSTDPNPAFSE